VLAPDLRFGVGQELIYAIGAESGTAHAAAPRSYCHDDSDVTGACANFIAHPQNKADTREVA
jgi:hypothetical protein